MKLNSTGTASIYARLFRSNYSRFHVEIEPGLKSEARPDLLPRYGVYDKVDLCDTETDILPVDTSIGHGDFECDTCGILGDQ